ncbi:hypothetical protein L2E82_06619 [Cichorium intybus]|uniref:Uncharacterized protein n=1 Tax=Cichorium intybus TaxID=13427 RepID=A0ACB9HBT9_CICIN|nr:hypothetical protein L2E82_06619 [Cichorium intybus]
MTSFHILHFTESNILSSLTDNNLIGSGGSGKVYQIEIGRRGEYVAVKRIWNPKKLNDTLEKEFLSEIHILGSIRHSNIIKLLCCISSEDSKILVYEYMENQSLDKLLHGKKRKSQRGIADFGLAKILTKPNPGQTNILIAGSFGYIPPEYAYSTRVNEKVDVYSFGVVLLELVTGKEAHEGDGDMNLAEWAWRNYREGKSMVEALDPEIKQDNSYIEEIRLVFKLGLVCTSTFPSSRPTMREVVGILQRCNPVSEAQNKVLNESIDDLYGKV